jgi:hypothetical protein
MARPSAFVTSCERPPARPRASSEMRKDLEPRLARTGDQALLEPFLQFFKGKPLSNGSTILSIWESAPPRRPRPTARPGSSLPSPESFAGRAMRAACIWGACAVQRAGSPLRAAAVCDPTLALAYTSKAAARRARRQRVAGGRALPAGLHRLQERACAGRHCERKLLPRHVRPVLGPRLRRAGRAAPVGGRRAGAAEGLSAARGAHRGSCCLLAMYHQHAPTSRRAQQMRRRARLNTLLNYYEYRRAFRAWC